MSLENKIEGSPYKYAIKCLIPGKIIADVINYSTKEDFWFEFLLGGSVELLKFYTYSKTIGITLAYFSGGL